MEATVIRVLRLFLHKFRQDSLIIIYLRFFRFLKEKKLSSIGWSNAMDLYSKVVLLPGSSAGVISKRLVTVRPPIVIGQFQEKGFFHIYPGFHLSPDHGGFLFGF